jgi:hypothetical protein
MIHINKIRFSILLIGACLLVACGGNDAVNATVKPAATTANATQNSGAKQTSDPIQSSPGKISAPININYSITGNPIVGMPVGINIEVSSEIDDREILLHYRVNEYGSLIFPETQVQSVSLLPLADAVSRSQQVTVVPQREGRIYLVVSAEIETDGGTMIKSMSIPIQVGRAPREAKSNGNLVKDADGEAGISMPATEP